jgi:hypothetical protein
MMPMSGVLALPNIRNFFKILFLVCLHNLELNEMIIKKVPNRLLVLVFLCILFMILYESYGVSVCL